MTITINLKGRLGNQLFQYATLRNLSIIKGYDFYIDTNFKWHGQSNLLNCFNIKQSSLLSNIRYHYFQPNNSNFYDINVLNINDNTILDGHFENIQYFEENKEIIQNELTIKDKNINEFTDNYFNKLASDGSKIVGIHFRRGDVAQESSNINEFNIKLENFVNESLKKIMETELNIKLLIFTGGTRTDNHNTNYSHDNDILWVKKFMSNNISIYNMHISPGTIKNNELIDYSLLSKCDYLITPYQSTFAFMAYYTSKKSVKIFSLTNLYGFK